MTSDNELIKGLENAYYNLQAKYGDYPTLESVILSDLNSLNVSNVEKEFLNAYFNNFNNVSSLMESDVDTSVQSVIASSYFAGGSAYLKDVSKYYKNVNFTAVANANPDKILSEIIDTTLIQYQQPVNDTIPKASSLSKLMFKGTLGVGAFSGYLEVAEEYQQGGNYQAEALKQYTIQSSSAIAGLYVGSGLGPVGAVVGAVVGGAVGFVMDHYWDDALQVIKNAIDAGKTAIEAAEEALTDYQDLMIALVEDPTNVIGIIDFGENLIDDVAENLPEYPELGIPDWVQNIINEFGIAEITPSPLVLDLDGDGIELAAINTTGSVYWDSDIDDFAEKSGWIAGGDGLLAVDVNSDGIINNHSELFGDQTGSPNGFVALEAYDSDNSGTITSADTNFGDLLVWVDSDADGFSDSAELYTLNQLGITSIDLGYTNVNYQISGNDIKQESSFVINGQTNTIVDAYFTTDQTNTQYVGDYTLDVRTLFLPTLRGYGNLPDLHIAMSQDSTLFDLVEDLAGQTPQTLLSDIYDITAKITEIAYQWAGVQNVDPTSRGANVDGQKLEFLEELIGRDWVGVNNTTNPYPDPGGQLEDTFDKVISAFTSQILVQTEGRTVLDSDATYNAVTGEIENDFIPDHIEVFDSSAEYYNAVNGEDNWHIWSVGDGNDSIYENNGQDKLILHDVIADDVRFEVDSTSLHVHIGNEKITLVNHLYMDYYPTSTDDSRQLEELALQDGTVIDLVNNNIFKGTDGVDSVKGLRSQDSNLYGLDGNDVLNAYDNNDYLDGGAGNDNLYGNEGNDTLLGGLGDDTLRGLEDDDTYIWDVGDGNDLIMEDGGADKILLGSSVNANDVRFWKSGTDIQIHIGSEYIEVNNHFYYTGGAYRGTDYVETLEYSDGSTVDLTQNLTFTGTNSNEYVYALKDSDDTLSGLGGNDYLYGDTGNDTLIGGDGDDYLFGDEDTDVALYSGNYADYTITNLPHYFNVQDNVGTEGLDRLYDIETIEFADGTYDTATETFTAFYNVIEGNTSTETINGTSADDLINGYGGNDTIKGLAGDDLIYGGIGNDKLYGANGNFSSSVESNTLYGEDGNDKIYAQSGSDMIYGGAGEDRVFYTGSSTTGVSVNLTTGEVDENKDGIIEDILNSIENVSSSHNDDLIVGDAGNNKFSGFNGDDVLYGEAGNDTIISGNGDDILYGGDGNDILSGGSNQDTLYGGAGIDTLTGGNHADTFVLESASAFSNVDVINDFDVSEGDVLDIADLLGAYDPLADALSDFVSKTEVSGHTYFAVDADGGADNFINVVRLQNVTGLSDVDTLETNGNLITS